MAAAEGPFDGVISVEDSGPPEYDDDDDSFYVVENCDSNVSSPANGEILPPLRTNKVHEMQDLIKSKIEQINSVENMPELPSAVNTVQAVTSSIAKITISPDSSYEEIQKQVEDLIKENETLKNTIAQNNMSMKTQYERFVTYRDDVNKVLKSYKDKINEAKLYVDKCKDENLKLGSEVEIYVNLKKLHEEEIINLKERIRNQETTGFVAVKHEETELKESARSLELQSQLVEANLKLAELSHERDDLQSTFNELTIENEGLKDRLKKTNARIKMLEDQNEIMKASIQKLEQKLEVKQGDIDKLTEKLVQTSKLEEELLFKEDRNAVLQTEVSSSRNKVRELQSENEDLREKLNNASKISESHLQTVTSIGSYQTQLEQKDAEMKKLKEKLAAAEYRELSDTREMREMSGKLKDAEDDYYQVRSQLSISQQTITALETEQQEKIRETEKLRKLIQESQTRDDEIFALKEQLDLYKTDFEVEKESRTALERERKRLTEDLQQLQTRMKQLENEVETWRARRQPREQGYPCPKCSHQFSSYQSLESHVHRCLDLDDVI